MSYFLSSSRHGVTTLAVGAGFLRGTGEIFISDVIDGLSIESNSSLVKACEKAISRSRQHIGAFEQWLCRDALCCFPTLKNLVLRNMAPGLRRIPHDS
jgi:hypothetical protein